MSIREDLSLVLEQTRMESCGTTLDAVARIICGVYSESEVNILIERLYYWIKKDEIV